MNLEFVNSLNNASDKYIDRAKKTLQPEIDKRNKENKTKGDLGSVLSFNNFNGDPEF